MHGVSVKRGPDACGFLVSLLCLPAWLVTQLFARCVTIQLETIIITFSLGSIEKANLFTNKINNSGLCGVVLRHATETCVFLVRNVLVIRCSIGTRQEFTNQLCPVAKPNFTTNSAKNLKSETLFFLSKPVYRNFHKSTNVVVKFKRHYYFFPSLSI